MEQLNQTNLGKLTLQKQLKIRENLCILETLVKHLKHLCKLETLHPKGLNRELNKI